jgi:ribose transport system substrate-binding protein
MKRLLAAGAAVFVCLALGGLPTLGQSPSAGVTGPTAAPTHDITIGFSNFGTGFWFSDALGNGVREAATAAGVRLLPADAQWSGALQARQIEDFVKQGVDAIVAVPWETSSIASAVASAVAAANDAGIPVLAIDPPVGGVTVTSRIGADDMAASRAAGEYLFKAMGGSGKVLELQHVPGWAEPRAEGFKQTLDATPSITLVDAGTADADAGTAEALTSRFLTTNPDLTGVFAHNDDMALGAARAIAAAGLTDKVTVVGFDGSPDGLMGVKDGALAATVAKQPLLIGRTAMETAIKAAAGEKVDAFVPVETVLVTRDNVDQFLAQPSPSPLK